MNRSGRRALAPLVATLLLAASPAASGRADDPGPVPATRAPLEWEWQPSLLYYVLPHETGYFQPTLAVDRGGLHLEGRYNYEARETGSAWLGWNFSFGEDLQIGLTPMVGVVFGELKGLAPGLTFTLEWGPVALWSQGEWVLDLVDASQSYVYVWSELGITGPEWLRVGVVLQRTRAVRTSTQFQGGPLVGLQVWKLAATAYLFAPGQEDQFVVVALAGSF